MLAFFSYFLGLEVPSSFDDAWPSQSSQIYFEVLTLSLELASQIARQLIYGPIEYTCLRDHDYEHLHDTILYKQLVRSLVYLKVIRLDISYAMHIIIQFWQHHLFFKILCIWNASYSMVFISLSSRLIGHSRLTLMLTK